MPVLLTREQEFETWLRGSADLPDGFLGAKIGIIAVLHTWGSAMTHHPHVHMTDTSGGISPMDHAGSPHDLKGPPDRGPKRYRTMTQESGEF